MINLQNIDKNLCVICGEPTIAVKMTCSEGCHEKFVEFCEE